MYLKSLELQGFKSFPDKTLIRFGDDITAIVGPNGSGKSNISDAILWVMGEQSYKTLRGAKMEDVIFGGTQKRAAVGFAEATLTLDNRDRALGYDADEVMVTRRYYRSGDSEFYINKQSARLRDIHELFMDTGLGREGYSNIGQGRIDEILSLKSADRREIFEEAAGISKYRHRKDEAERKLEKTEDNLVRVRDVLGELKSRVGPLQRQSEKARKYLDIREELKGIEVSASVDIIDKNRQEAAKYEELLKIASEDTEREKKNLLAMEKESDALYALLKENDEKTSSLRDDLDKAKEEYNNHVNNIKLLSNNIENYKTNILSIEAEKSANEHLMGEAEKSLFDAKEEEDKLTEKLNALKEELLRLEADGAVVSDDMAQKGVAVEQVRSKIRDMERALSEADTKSASLEVLKESIETRRFSIEVDITSSRDSERRLKTESERLGRDIEEAKRA